MKIFYLSFSLVEVVSAHHHDGRVGAERDLRLVDAQLLAEQQEVARLLRRRQPLQLLQLPLVLEDQVVALKQLKLRKQICNSKFNDFMSR